MAIYAGILVVVMLMIKLIPLVTLGDTWAQVHRPYQPRLLLTFYHHYYYCTYYLPYLLSPNLPTTWMHTQSGNRLLLTFYSHYTQYLPAYLLAPNL